MQHRMGAAARRCRRGDAVPRHLPRGRGADAAAPRGARRAGESNFTILDTDDQQRLMKQVLDRTPASTTSAGRRRRSARSSTASRTAAGRPSRCRRARRATSPTARCKALVRALPGAAGGIERRRFRRPAAAHADDLPQATPTCWRSISGASNTCWSTSIRTPTSRNICGCGCSRRSGATSPASATTISRSIRGAAPKSPTSCASSKDFPGATVIRLEQNYRSTPHILAAAGGLIAHNGGRLGKTLWTDRNYGDKVRSHRRLGRPRGGAAGRRDRSSGCNAREPALNDCAILVRAQFQTREFEDRFITLGLPYKIVGGFRFYERAEIRDALAYLRVVVQPSDGLAFERIVNVPKRGLGDKALADHPRPRPRHWTTTEPCRRSDHRDRRADRRGAPQPRGADPRHRALARSGRYAAPPRAGAHRPRGIGLSRHVAGRPLARGSRARRQPPRTDARHGGVRVDGGVPRPCRAGHGERSLRRQPRKSRS